MWCILRLRLYNLVVGVLAYLVFVCFGSSGPTEAWCDVGVSAPVGGLQPKLFLAAWALRRTEEPSCVSWRWPIPRGELFCSPWWPAGQEADSWQQSVETWPDLLVDDKTQLTSMWNVSAVEFILPFFTPELFIPHTQRWLCFLPLFIHSQVYATITDFN